MQVIVKSGAIVRHQMEKEVAKPAALEQMKQRYEGEKFKSTDQWHIKRGYSSDAKKNIGALEKNLDKVNPERLSPESKDMMWRRAKQLKDEFSVGMLSHEELHPVKGFSENGTTKWVVDEERMRAQNSIERNAGWIARNEKKVREYKNIMRHLCPENPNAGDIEKFRPKLKGIR
jgi:hypothetical protein